MKWKIAIIDTQTGEDLRVLTIDVEEDSLEYMLEEIKDDAMLEFGDNIEVVPLNLLN